jgi:hypothetical protein
MINVCIIQADNRPNLNFLHLTRDVNKKTALFYNYQYLFIEINSKYGDLHPATKKIYIINEYLKNENNTAADILIFLDSDAWVQNGEWLHQIIDTLAKTESKQGCYSREPYIDVATFINSGSFILKVNDYAKKMYAKIVDELENNSESKKYHQEFPYDQYYISNYVFEHKEDFMIFHPTILNTPIGEVLRHNWYKCQSMYDDCNKILNNELIINEYPFNIERHLDIEPFPNLAPERKWLYFTY